MLLTIALLGPLLLNEAFCSSPSMKYPPTNEIRRGVRTKRLVWGTPLTDVSSYDSVGYQVFLGNGHRCNKLLVYLKKVFGQYDVCNPTPGHLMCGGSLIMPNIVQTCCHCIAQFYYVNITYRGTRALSQWENWMVVFHGYTLVHDMDDDGSWSRKFFIHQNCAEVMSGTISHDYGLILLNQPLLLNRPFLKIAPVYTKNELERRYTYSVQKESVCLFIGFGYYYWQRPGIPGAASDVLMHGWRLIRGYWWCYWEIYFMIGKLQMENYGYSYINKATWVCSSFFGKQRAHILQGDSGSPITCSNEYFGMNSFMTLLYTKMNHSVEMLAAIAFVPAYNAIEYRKSLVTVTMRDGDDDERLAPSFRPNLENFYKDKYEQDLDKYLNVTKQFASKRNSRNSSPVISARFLLATLSVLLRQLSK